MMRVLEFLAWKVDMRKITLAVGKSNLEVIIELPDLERDLNLVTLIRPASSSKSVSASK